MKIATSLAAGAVLALGAGMAMADDFRRLDLTQVIGLEKVVEIVRAQQPNARIVEAELDDDHGGQWELELATADGNTQKLKLDARTGEPVARKQ